MTGRFNLVQAPPKDPGHCWITRTTVGPFIDTGVDLSVGKIDRGRIYLSVDAVREMAQLAGLFDEKEPASVALRKKRWYDEGYNDAMKEISGDAVNRFIEHVSRTTAGAAGDSAVVESAGHLSTAGAAIPASEDAGAGAPEVDQDVDGLELESAEPALVKGPSSVSADSSNERDYRL